MPKNANVYVGKNSTAKIPTSGKVNTDWETLRTIYAASYDSLNKNLLTRTPGKFKKTNPRSLAGRFHVLKLLCYKYCPQKLPAVENLENLSLAHAEGKIGDAQFLQNIRMVAFQAGLPTSDVDMIESRIMAAEGRPKQRPPQRFQLDFLGQAVRNFFPPTRRRK